MSVLHALILGIIQGVAEFLPISSSGHLIVLQRLFGIEEPAFTFDIVVHIGSLVAIVIVFWRDILEIIKNPFSKMTGLLIVGTLPVVFAGLFMRNIIEDNFRSGIWLATAFTITGVFLIIADKSTNTTKEEKDITYLDALVVGAFQALALPPGITRSGTTIMGGLTRGISRAAAAKFSFMLAIIAIAGAGTLEAVQVVRSDYGLAGTVGATQLIVGFVASLVVGYFSIRLLLKLIRSCKLRYFSFYVWGLAALILLDSIVIGRFF